MWWMIVLAWIALDIYLLVVFCGLPLKEQPLDQFATRR